MHVEEGLEDVQHPRHLREQQAAVALAAEARQQLAYTSERRGGRTEHLELAAVVLEEALLRELHGVELTPLVDSASTCERERSDGHGGIRVLCLRERGGDGCGTGGERDGVHGLRPRRQHREVVHHPLVTRAERREARHQTRQCAGELRPVAHVCLHVLCGAAEALETGLSVAANLRGGEAGVASRLRHGSLLLAQQKVLNGLALKRLDHALCDDRAAV